MRKIKIVADSSADLLALDKDEPVALSFENGVLYLANERESLIFDAPCLS